MREQIKKLVQLQTLDTQIYSLREEKDSLPLKVEELRKDFEEKKKDLFLLEEKKKEILKQKKEKELELSSKEENIKKLQIQLYQLKTNKEYQAMLEQINGLKADVSVLEEEIIISLDKIDEADSQINQEKEFLKKREQQNNNEIKKIQTRIQEIEKTLEDLNFKRKRLTEEIDKKVLAVYERVLKNREGLALVPVKNNACQGCFMNVPPQVINEIKMNEHLVICEMCARILYLEEEL